MSLKEYLDQDKDRKVFIIEKWHLIVAVLTIIILIVTGIFTNFYLAVEWKTNIQRDVQARPTKEEVVSMIRAEVDPLYSEIKEMRREFSDKLEKTENNVISEIRILRTTKQNKE